MTNELDMLMSENKKLRVGLASVMKVYHTVVAKKPSNVEVYDAILRIHHKEFLDVNA
jgi:hypothetical protein